MERYTDFTGKSVIVTGASSGLGADAALAFAKLGASVALLARRKDRLDKLSEEIAKASGESIPIKCDVTCEEEVKEAVRIVFEKFGKIDVLLNNAGIAIKGAVDNMDILDWQRVFDVNVKGIFNTCKYVLPLMKQAQYGKIVNISSINAVVADKNEAYVRHAYNASKAAVKGFTIGMAATYMKYGITINTICPGLFESEMTTEFFHNKMFIRTYNALTTASRPGKRGELNGTIFYFSSDASSYVTGQSIIVDGGASLV